MMAEQVTRKLVEKRRRGFFGWVFMLLFWAFNALMVVSLFSGISKNAEQYRTLATEAERQGAAAGTGLGIMMLLMTWAAGAVVLGLLVLFTRGRKEMIELQVKS